MLQRFDAEWQLGLLVDCVDSHVTDFLLADSDAGINLCYVLSETLVCDCVMNGDRRDMMMISVLGSTPLSYFDCRQVVYC